MGPSQEDALEGGGGTGHLGEVLYRGDTGSVVVWGKDLGVVCAYGTEFTGGSCGVNDTGDEVEGTNSEGQFVAEGGSRKIDSGIGDTTAPDLHGQEAGDSGGMGGLTAYI